MSEARRPWRVAVIGYHPMPYHVAFYRALAADPRVEETVLYLDDTGVDARRFDPFYGRAVVWDNDVLSGYRYRFFRNLTWDRTRPPHSRINPGVFPHLLFGRYDAVLTDYATVSAWLTWAAARLSGTRILLRGEADLYAKNPGFWRKAKEAFIGTLMRGSTGIMYSCARNRDYFEHYGAPREKLFPLLSSVDNAWFAARAAEEKIRRRELRAAEGIPEDAVVALYVGRLLGLKRPADLVSAMAQLRDVENLWALVVGDGPEAGAIREVVAREGLSRVIVTGFRNQSELPGLYAISDLFVMPSTHDRTPKALNEAMVSGLLPVVSQGVGTVGDLVRDGENGHVFAVGDVESLAGHLRGLAGDPARRAQFAAEALATVRDWSPQANVDGVVAALEAGDARQKAL